MGLTASSLQGCMQGSLWNTVGAQQAVFVVILPQHAALLETHSEK